MSTCSYDFLVRNDDPTHYPPWRILWRVNCSIFIKHGPAYVGLGGEGPITAFSFTRQRCFTFVYYFGVA